MRVIHHPPSLPPRKKKNPPNKQTTKSCRGQETAKRKLSSSFKVLPSYFEWGRGGVDQRVAESNGLITRNPVKHNEPQVSRAWVTESQCLVHTRLCK